MSPVNRRKLRVKYRKYLVTFTHDVTPSGDIPIMYTKDLERTIQQWESLPKS